MIDDSKAQIDLVLEETALLAKQARLPQTVDEQIELQHLRSKVALLEEENMLLRALPLRRVRLRAGVSAKHLMLKAVPVFSWLPQKTKKTIHKILERVHLI